MVLTSLVGSKWVGAFSMLPALSEVQLSDCNIQNSTLFLSFANFSSLVVMNLRFNHLNPFPIWLVNISSLLYVDLSFNSMQGSIPLGFCKLPNLRLLNLKNNNLSVSSYQLFTQSWSKVKFLQLYNNSVHGKLPASIGSMTYLTHLDWSSNYIESGIPSSISKLCYLEYLDLSHNNLNGKLPEDLEGTNNCLGRSPLPHLQKLLLGNNQLFGMLPSWLGQLQNHVELSLNSNLFHGSVPALGAFRSLSILRLEESKLNGTLPDSWGQISKLSLLSVSSNHLTGNLPESLGKLSLLEYLYVSSNRLVGVVSESRFSNLLQLFNWKSYIFIELQIANI
ncbi:hypothetical protein GH714_040491 [Hevea brasiliensis]|uniref:Leucine-rich repeat-containing N-terminal plant-type domain-containing protein n=1 Tax=Hevea brasiliensis TaxID=3981 RepID=A0A6A6L525_HEVBR|nr:hypothetical protein GH714_040491 [Hevea brasiliensis]